MESMGPLVATDLAGTLNFAAKQGHDLAPQPVAGTRCSPKTKTMNRVMARTEALKPSCRHCASRAGAQCLPASGRSLKTVRHLLG